jgi:hypothetical protein
MSTGGAIAVGHPFGMTGARITCTLINSLQWHDKQFGLETMWFGDGQGWPGSSSGCSDQTGLSTFAHHIRRDTQAMTPSRTSPLPGVADPIDGFTPARGLNAQAGPVAPLGGVMRVATRVSGVQLVTTNSSSATRCPAVH